VPSLKAEKEKNIVIFDTMVKDLPDPVQWREYHGRKREAMLETF
jgi:hypothetical protein